MSYPRFKRARTHKFINRTTGDLTPSVATTNWTPWHATDFDIVLDGQLGDTILVTFGIRVNGGQNTGFDAFTLVGGTPINGVSGVAYSAGANAGAGGLFLPSGVSDSKSATLMYVLQSGDISGGTVTVRPYERQISGSGTTLTIYSSTTGGVALFGVENIGPVDPN